MLLALELSSEMQWKSENPSISTILVPANSLISSTTIALHPMNGIFTMIKIP